MPTILRLELEVARADSAEDIDTKAGRCYVKRRVLRIRRCRLSARGGACRCRFLTESVDVLRRNSLGRKDGDGVMPGEGGGGLPRPEN